MLTPSLHLPSSCCGPQVSWNSSAASDDQSIRVSVPCLLPATSEYSEHGPPRVHFVVVQEGVAAPSSLQVLEGCGGDGNLGLRHGSVKADRLQMRWWLTLHQFPIGIYDRLINQQEGVALYSGSFPYVGDWVIQNYPWERRGRIFAAAVNPTTHALSPTPVESTLIIRELSNVHCEILNSGLCWKCKPGFVLSKSRECQKCAIHCNSCDKSGPGRCDADGCLQGYGFSAGACFICGDEHCRVCDALPRANESNFLVANKQSLRCVQCEIGYGPHPKHGHCVPCQAKGCSSCASADVCDACRTGFVLVHAGNTSASCAPCSDDCNGCDLLGPGRCDPMRCNLGFSLTPAGLCATCSGHCRNCTTSGPGHCDKGQCKVQYGLQGGTECKECQAYHCEACDDAPGGKCDLCEEGFGLTPEGTCEACASDCKRCTRAGLCAECKAGFALNGPRCLACADQCLNCDKEGPRHCNEGQCAPGWATKRLDGWMVCVPCTDSTGSDGCPAWHP